MNKKKKMNKKKIFMAFAAVVPLVCGSFIRISAYADSDPIVSRGNFVSGGGRISVCASDMNYLRAEVQELYDELPSVTGVDASPAETARRDGIQSKGIINYGNGAVVFDSADFHLLVNEVDKLESEYKANAVNALRGIGTYFTPDGSITHDGQEGETLLLQDAAGLTFGAICEGILQSQSVDHLEAKPAVENNISAGAAAWVDGECIIGNGRDVREAYNQGYLDGMASVEPREARIEYIYHVHAGVSTQAGGCYAESYRQCSGMMAATDTGTFVPEMSNSEEAFYRYGRQCNICGYTDVSVSSGKPWVGQITGSCPQYTTSIVVNCGKTDKTIESATIYYK